MNPEDYGYKVLRGMEFKLLVEVAPDVGEPYDSQIIWNEGTGNSYHSDLITFSGEGQCYIPVNKLDEVISFLNGIKEYYEKVKENEANELQQCKWKLWLNKVLKFLRGNQ